MIGDDQHLINLEHAKNPKIGDYWNERFLPVAVVVDVSKFAVTVCEKTIDLGDKWTWNFEELETYTRKDFINRYRYGRTNNKNFIATDEDRISNKFWCDVSPKGHKKLIMQFRRELLK